ncbi:MAG: hypothetical protein DRJ61_15915 [Acidobacteria bacterium]|nr:MAG: hypothetical protein DRJ65_03495 [Acidobacteriota bacterium]RLE28719.1 MAG: hypothetical protein DRJ61_15915 [Acidobacteriota bacterium]
MDAARIFLVITLGLATLVCGGCEDTTPDPEARIAVEQAVTTYLHALTEAYSNLSIEPIEDLATGAEVQGVRKMLRGLAGTGDRVEARLRSVEFTRIDIFRVINATVATTEVWDVTQFDAFNGREKGRNPTSIQDSIIQLRLIDGLWKVTGRRVIGQEAGRRWKIDDVKPENPEVQ